MKGPIWSDRCRVEVSVTRMDLTAICSTLGRRYSCRSWMDYAQNAMSTRRDGGAGNSTERDTCGVATTGFAYTVARLL
jgi:hypothetical protein